MELTIISFLPRVLGLILIGGALWLIERQRPWVPVSDDQQRSIQANLTLAALTIGLNAAFALIFTEAVLRVAGPQIGLLRVVEAPAWLEWSVAILLLDLFAYFAHRLLHSFAAGWRVHRVHHSDWQVDVTTSLRQHPLESAWRYLFQIAGILCLGPPAAAVAMYVALSGINALLEHSNLALPRVVDRWLSLVFVTPNMHKNHHARDQTYTDSNYANLFALWDRLFATYTTPIEPPRLQYGLDGYDAKNARTPGDLLRLPFRSELPPSGG